MSKFYLLSIFMISTIFVGSLGFADAEIIVTDYQIIDYQHRIGEGDKIEVRESGTLFIERFAELIIEEGGILLNSGGTIIIEGTIINQDKGILTNSGEITNEHFAYFTNEEGGLVINSGDFTNVSQYFLNQGTIINKGTIVNDLVIKNENSISNDGTITNNKIIKNSGSITNGCEGIIEGIAIEINAPIEAQNCNGGGECLIATAAYGSEMAPQVQFLREIRDNTLLSTTTGTTFMTGFNAVYYSFAPTVAGWERENPMFQEVVRAFITPMISSLSIMGLASEGSEAEVLGLGLSVITLNLGMYIAAPALIGFKVHKHFKSKNS